MGWINHRLESFLVCSKNLLLMTLSVVGIFGLGVVLLVAAVLLTDMMLVLPLVRRILSH